MSGTANGREYRKQVLKELIRDLHEGQSVDMVRARFLETFQSVSALEISEAEQSLINDGMPVSEVQRLCDVHASVFKGNIEDMHAPGATATDNASAVAAPDPVSTHVIRTLKAENRAMEELIGSRINPSLEALKAMGKPDGITWRDTVLKLAEDLDALSQVHLHYLKKENLLFPLLEKHGITAPPKVMWGVDDEIRAKIKRARAVLSDAETPVGAVLIEDAITQLEEMIFKEESILFPMCQETFSSKEWELILGDLHDIGWCLIEPPEAGDTILEPITPAQQSEGFAGSSGNIVLPTGVLKLSELTGLLNALPIDITFVDKNDTVRYFSEGKDRIFARTRAIIGRSVSACHPPNSVHVVEQLLKAFKEGLKDSEDFWINMGEKYVLIRYYAVRDNQGAYLGTVEMTQDIAPIQVIEGQKRLMD